MLCPECRADIGKGWEPYRLGDRLCIAWRCPNGHRGQINGVEMVFPPLVPIAPQS